jgi:hypothetical protein
MKAGHEVEAPPIKAFPLIEQAGVTTVENYRG